MNQYDSDRMLAQLESIGYRLCETQEEADLILFNTCSVREGAANKVRSALGTAARLKQKKPNLLLAVAGCVASTEGGKLRDRRPELDILVTPDTVLEFGKLVELAEKQNENRKRNSKPIFIEPSENKYLFAPPSLQPSVIPPSAYVTVMKGCDNYCSYCIVPYARGREESRNPEDVVAEVKELVKRGAKEIILLGQNVNSYRFPQETKPDFAKLLHYIADVKGLKRLRFVTSHPKDFNESLARTFSEIPILCPYLHLPPQAGSDKILKLMNRKYSRKEYLEKIDMIRHHKPDIAISADFIVGFPQETEEDFEETLSLINQVRFDMIYAFKYSTRQGTAAEKLDGALPLKIKQGRLSRLLALSDNLMYEVARRRYEGKSVSVLVEGPSENNATRLTGRTLHNRVVNFENQFELSAGDIVSVEITGVELHSLLGTVSKRESCN